MTADAVPDGLPGPLPPGERILWQGRPEAGRLARTAFHVGTVAIYFAALTAVALGLAVARGGGAFPTVATAGCGVLAVGLLGLIGWWAARGTVYTLTDRRIVMRIGIALPKSVNLPLARIAAVDLSSGGDVALRLTDAVPLGWAALWPHARPWRIGRPEPMLRGLTDAEAVARRIARACLAVQPDGRLAPVPVERPREPAMAEVIAA